MKLELNIIRINDILFTNKTSVEDGVLSIDRIELSKILEADTRLKDFNIELTKPGEKCRIIRVVDVIEPRAKIVKGGQEYPGGPDQQGTVGRGSTLVLRGVAVVISENRSPGDPGRASTGIIDMWGEGARMGPYGKTCNVVVMARPAGGITPDEYHLALKIAGLKTAAYLARAGTGVETDGIEAYDLPPVTEPPEDYSKLPVVTYIFQVLTNQYEPIAGDPVLYGDNIKEIVPTILHPNEVLDGAITTPYSSAFMETYMIQNHPVILELYRQHNRSLCFRGVIISTAPNNAPEYERTATVAANLAKWTLGADGAVLTKCGGGAPELVMARTAQKCEQMGIKTAMALIHMGLDTTEISMKASTIFSDVPELDAMISMGTPAGNPLLELEPADRIIGTTDGSEQGGKTLLRLVRGAISQLGDSRLIAVRY
ncbi:glycine/sarcosine/betaine reductase component B subunit [Chloroflexota bacterium]